MLKLMENKFHSIRLCVRMKPENTPNDKAKSSKEPKMEFRSIISFRYLFLACEISVKAINSLD